MMHSDWIRESNLIEGVNNTEEDLRCWKTWVKLHTAKFCISNILRMHKHIMWNLDRQIAGKWRQCNVQVGSYIAPNWFTVPSLMQEWWKEWCEASTEEDIKKAHVAFEKIHPFVDGNGRVGRMVMNWQMHRAGLPPILILYSQRNHYYEWFRQ